MLRNYLNRKKMSTELVKKSLWMLFGITLFKALDSIIISLIYYTFHQVLENNYYFVSKVKLFILSIIIGLYLIAIIYFAISIAKKSHSKLFRIKENIPIYTFIATLIIAIFLEPLTLYISKKKIENAFNVLSKAEYMSTINLSSMDEFLRNSIYICRWSAFIILVAYLFVFMNRLKHKTY